MKCYSVNKIGIPTTTSSNCTTSNFTTIMCDFTPTTSTCTAVQYHTNTVKVPLFKGLGNEEPDQFWFVVKAIWEAQDITYDHLKKETLVGALQDRTLTWYIKYSNDNPNVGVVNIQTMLNKEFSRPKYEAQLIMGFERIVMKLGETPWELDHILKCKIHETNINLADGQHHEWFVASFSPHLRVALSREKIMTQAEAFETTMRLHETPV